MSLIALPIMMRYGYDRHLATGVIMASGTLAQLIPPSIILIVLADQLSVSVGAMSRGALVPSLVLVGLYVGYVFLVSVTRPHAVPALPPEARNLNESHGKLGYRSLLVLIGLIAAVFAMAQFVLLKLKPDIIEADLNLYASTIAVVLGYLIVLLDKHFGLGLFSNIARAVIIVLVPPLALVFLVLGTILLGIATPTEGGAMGAIGALMLAMAKRRLTLPILSQSIEATAKLSAFVLFILIGARVFALTFYGVNGHVWVEHLLLAIPGGVIGFLVLVNAIVFVLGFFLDFFEIAFILIPLLVPVAAALDINLVWFGVMLAVNLQSSYLTPPFGFALFFMRSVTPASDYVDKITQKTIRGIKTSEIYRAGLVFVVIQLLMIALLVLFPELVDRSPDLSNIDTSNIKIDLPPPLDLDLPPPT